MRNHWLVERAPGIETERFEDCGFEFVTIECGALVFRHHEGSLPDYIIAAGQWRTVVREDAE